MQERCDVMEEQLFVVKDNIKSKAAEIVSEANQKIANTFRIFADKEGVDYYQKEKKFYKMEMVKKPWLAKKKILEAMEL